MSIPVVRFLAVIEIDGTIDRAEDLFREFQELVEGGCARSVWRATLEDLEDFAPKVVHLPEGRIDTVVDPVREIAEPHYED